METINIDGKQYNYLCDYKHDEKLRSALSNITREVFGFDISDWYRSGYWGDNYVPHSLFDGDKIVSNISVSEIEFCHLNQKRKYVQIGTVMTSPEYRHKRLNRALMDKVLETWRGKCDLIYLFANNTVLDFYPKFGFHAVQEYQYSKSVRCEGSAKSPIKLDITNPENQALVFDIACQAAPVAALSMQDNASLIMFWLLFFYSDLVYFSEEHQAVIVMKQEESRLLLLDVLCKTQVDLNALLPSLITSQMHTLVLGFTPQNKSSYEERKLSPDDVLYVMDDACQLCDGEKFMFPLLSHA